MSNTDSKPTEPEIPKPKPTIEQRLLDLEREMAEIKAALTKRK